MAEIGAPTSQLLHGIGPVFRQGDCPGVPLSVGAGLPTTRKTGDAALTLVAGRPAPARHEPLFKRSSRTTPTRENGPSIPRRVKGILRQPLTSRPSPGNDPAALRRSPFFPPRFRPRTRSARRRVEPKLRSQLKARNATRPRGTGAERSALPVFQGRSRHPFRPFSAKPTAPRRSNGPSAPTQSAWRRMKVGMFQSSSSGVPPVSLLKKFLRRGVSSCCAASL